MKKWIYISIILFVLLSGFMVAESVDTETDISHKNDPSPRTLGIQRLIFFTEVNPVLNKAGSEGKPVFVYARSKYCGACKLFESETFTNESVIEKLNNDFILLSIDVDEQKNETRNFRLRVTPTEIFLDQNGIEIKRLLGYRTNQTFLDELNRITT